MKLELVIELPDGTGISHMCDVYVPSALDALSYSMDEYRVYVNDKCINDWLRTLRFKVSLHVGEGEEAPEGLHHMVPIDVTGCYF